MIVRPWYLAHDVLKQNYLRRTDQLFAIQAVDPTFDKRFNDDVFKLIANGREIRTVYVDGIEIGDPVNRYYLQIC